MLKLPTNISVYLYYKPVDFRKAINGLSEIILDEQIDNLQSGNLVIFYNRSKDKVKILFWDKNGFVLHYKYLQKIKFKFYKINESTITISHDQLNWLLADLDFEIMGNFPELNYCNYI